MAKKTTRPTNKKAYAKDKKMTVQKKLESLERRIKEGEEAIAARDRIIEQRGLEIKAAKDVVTEERVIPALVLCEMIQNLTVDDVRNAVFELDRRRDKLLSLLRVPSLFDKNKQNQWQ